MAYHVYHTEAIILESRPFGEGDRLLFCYTHELGFVVAHAKSLRELRSRLRYALTTFAHAEIDLIRGKHGWKLISARPVNSHRSLLLHEYLFDDILSAIKFLNTQVEIHEFRSAELVFIVRLLSQLGYWENTGEFSYLLDPDVWNKKQHIELVTQQRANILARVNTALKATQL